MVVVVDMEFQLPALPTKLLPKPLLLLLVLVELPMLPQLLLLPLLLLQLLLHLRPLRLLQLRNKHRLPSSHRQLREPKLLPSLNLHWPVKLHRLRPLQMSLPPWQQVLLPM